MSDSKIHQEAHGGWFHCCSCPFSLVVLTIAIIAVLQYTGVIPRLLRSLLHTFFAKVFPDFHKHFNAHMATHKKQLFAGLANDFDADGKLHIVEIGAGAGANFKFFPRGARVTCIEPNDKIEKALKQSVEETEGAIILEEFHVGKAEKMTQFKDDSVDAVVCSLVMCSVDDVDATLKEVKRILKPGGKLYFIEHTLAEKGTPERIPQLFLLYLMKFVIQKNINRDAYVNIYRAGFSDVQLEFYDAAHLKQTVAWWIRPFVATRYYQGIIRK